MARWKGAMSALGQRETRARVTLMSALPPKSGHSSLRLSPTISAAPLNGGSLKSALTALTCRWRELSTASTAEIAAILLVRGDARVPKNLAVALRITLYDRVELFWRIRGGN